MPDDVVGFNSFSKLSTALIKNFENIESLNTDEKISVNILVSKVASWYEKLRTSMDYGNEETILRRAIERILKRLLFLDEGNKVVAENLVRELVWAGYFQDLTLSESIIEKVAASIRLHLALKDKVIEKRSVPGADIYEFMVQLLSSDIDAILLPHKEKEAMSNFMFQILRNTVDIIDDSKQTRDVQVFIAIRKNFARDDAAFLKYKLFLQIFGKLTDDNFGTTIENFAEGFNEITYQLSYPKKDRIFNHIKRNTPPFLILYELLKQEKGNIKEAVKDPEGFRDKVFAVCQSKYRTISRKIRTAIVRSFIFVLVTKAFIALFVEGTFERIFFGSIQWVSIGINTVAPPLLMVIVGLAIKTPDKRNSQKIYEDIYKLLFDENPQITQGISIKLKANSVKSIRDYIFSILWFLSILLVFGLISIVLTKLRFNILSQGIFLFFIAIISFLTYRIYQAANMYTVIQKQNILTPIIDFFFVPVIRVGRGFTEGIAQLNFTLIVIDFIIEAPFKGLVGFFEQWFSFLANKREELE